MSEREFKVVDYIYETDDYSVFNFEESNRSIRNINSLTENIRKNGLQQPLTVNKEMVVIDGQHRLQVLKNLGMPVQFRINENAGIHEILSMNTDTKNWTENDFIVHYAKLGFEDYQVLISLSERYQIPLSNFLRSNLTSGDFKNGELKLKPVEEIIGICLKYRDYCEATGLSHKGQTSFRAFRNLLEFENYDHNYFIRKAEQLTQKMKLNSTVTGVNNQLLIFLEVNNYGLKETSAKYINYFLNSKGVVVAA